MEPINLNLQLSYNDLKGVVSALGGEHGQIKRWLINSEFLIFGILAIISIFYSSSKILDVIFTVVVCYIILSFVGQILAIKKIKKGWQRNTVWHSSVQYEFSESGIKNITIFDKVEMSWEALYQIKEFKDFFVLVILNDFFHIIPKRAFKDNSQIEQFKNLLKLKANAKTSFMVEKSAIKLKGTLFKH